MDAALQAAFQTPFLGKKKLTLEFVYRGRPFTTVFNFEKHQVGGAISVAIWNGCLLLQTDFPLASSTLADFSRNSPATACFTPILETTGDIKNVDVLLVLLTKLAFLLIPAGHPHTITDVMQGDDGTYVSVSRVLQGRDAYYEKYGYTSPLIHAVKGWLQTLEWGALPADIQRLFVADPAATAAIPATTLLTDVIQEKKPLLTPAKFSALISLAFPHAHTNLWNFSLDRTNPIWTAWSDTLVFTRVDIGELLAGGFYRLRRRHSRRRSRSRSNRSNRSRRRSNIRIRH